MTAMTAMRASTRRAGIAARFGLMLGMSIAAAACGSEDPLSAKLETPDAKRAEVSLAAAVELPSSLGSFADRVAIEEILISLRTVHLLGSHPALPQSGLSLLDKPGRVSASPNEGPAWSAPIPPEYRRDRGLSVYFRIDRTADLPDHSVIVRGRLYKESVDPTFALTAATDPDGDPAHEHGTPVGATDPDGDPAHEGDGPRGATDPDGDPAHEGATPVEATDPDGDPAIDELKARLSPDANAWIPFELRDHEAAELATVLQNARDFHVVLGIPAGRWFTPRIVDQLNHELALWAASLPYQTDPKAQRDTIVIDRRDARPQGAQFSTGLDAQNAFFLTIRSEADLDHLTIKRQR